MAVSSWQIWLLILAIGVGTFALRLSFFQLWGRVREPGWLPVVLRPVPVVVLAALVASSLWIERGVADLTADPSRTLAALTAALVAWRFKSLLATIVTGMAVLWLLQWVW